MTNLNNVIFGDEPNFNEANVRRFLLWTCLAIIIFLILDGLMLLCLFPCPKLRKRKYSFVKLVNFRSSYEEVLTEEIAQENEQNQPEVSHSLLKDEQFHLCPIMLGLLASVFEYLIAF